MGTDLETLLTTLPTIDVCPDMLIADASTDSLLHTLPTVDVCPDVSLALALGLARMCGTATVVAPIVRAISTR